MNLARNDRIYGIPYTLQEENFHWNLNFGFSLMANSLMSISLTLTLLNFNSANYKIFKYLSIVTYITIIQKSEFANILYR